MSTRNSSTCTAVAILASLLAGCGGNESPDTSAATAASGATSGKSTQSQAASAEEVAREARGNVKCPAKVKTPQRAAGAPAIDVVGVVPGMTYDEAANVVMCTHDLLVVTEDKSRGFRIETYGAQIRKGFNASFAKERVEKTSRQIMQEMQDRAMARANNRVVRDVLPGQAKWYVSTIGLPGEERVINAAREEWFEEGSHPPIAAVQQALIEKYGRPTEMHQQHNGPVELRWAYDPRGRAITETSPLYMRCSGTADPDHGANVTPDCGIVVAARIHPLRTNPALSEYMQVGVVDQAGGYELLTVTEQSLQQSEMQRRAAQVEEAMKSTKRPTL
jgi:hypothetical protein